MASGGDPDNHDHLPKYKTQHYGKFVVNENSDSKVCYITDICQLLDGTIVIADYRNQRLKKLDQSYTLLDSLGLTSYPDSVCNVGPDEVAVSLYDAKKVQYISVKRDMRFTRSLRTGSYCRGMVYVDGKLYVCCGSVLDSASGCIAVYDNADHLQTFMCGLSSIPLYITVTDDSQHLLFSSWKSDNITMMNRTGNVVKTFSDGDLKQPRGMCTDGKGQVFVCGEESNTVVQLDPKQQNIDVILGEEDGVRGPYAICYDRQSSRLFIGSSSSNNLLVLTLK